MDEPRLDAEFYRRVSEINGVMCFHPRSAQEKYAAVRDALETLRATPGASDAERDELVREYDRLFDLVSFSFPDPARQRAEDLGLEQATAPRSLRIAGPARSSGDSPALTEDLY